MLDDPVLLYYSNYIDNAPETNMTNLYEVTYKTSAKARKVYTAIRCGKTENDASLQPEDCIVISVRYVGELCGEWCPL